MLFSRILSCIYLQEMRGRSGLFRAQLQNRKLFCGVCTILVPGWLGSFAGRILLCSLRK